MAQKIKFRLAKAGLERINDKYLASPLSNGTLDLAAIGKKISEGRPAIDQADVTLGVSAIAGEIESYVRQGYTVSTPIGHFSPDISGSVPSMDSELSGDNSFKVTFTANASVNAELAALVPVNDADQLSVKIESVEDVATHEGKIKGTANFILTGKNMSATRTDESLAIISETGAVVSNVTVVGESDGLGQRIIAKLATALPRGVYRLRLITKGYTAPSADPITYVKKVEVA